MKNKYLKYTLLILGLCFISGILFFLPSNSKPPIATNDVQNATSTQATTQMDNFILSEDVLDWSSQMRMVTSTESMLSDNSPAYIVQEVDLRSKFFTLGASYPQIQRLPSESKQKKVNEDIKNFIDQELEAAKPDLIEIKHAQSVCSGDYPPASCLGTYDIHGQVSVLNSRYLSVAFGVYGMGIMSVHPYHSARSLHYNLQNGERMLLRDFFKPNSGYLSIISAKVISDLKNQMGANTNDEQIQSGGGLDEKNFSNFILKENGVEFFFSDYQVASYAQGNPVVTVPYSELGGFLDPEFESQIPTFASSTFCC
ncbi:MAG: RsiV family protein [Patescibacteria group bacterium]